MSQPSHHESTPTPYSHAHLQHLLSALQFHEPDLTHTHHTLLQHHQIRLEDGMVGVNGLSAASECVQIAGKLEKVRMHHNACLLAGARVFHNPAHINRVHVCDYELCMHATKL